MTRWYRIPSGQRMMRTGSLLSVSVFLASLAGGAPAGARAQEWEPDYFSALRARSLGPAGMSARIAAIDAVEADPNVIFAGAATGGLWKSENGGQTWESLFDGLGLSGIGAVAVFQPNPSIVWVGTGEGNPRNSAGVGAGIYRSADGGHTWTLLGLERSERIHRILLHPSDPDIAYAGVMGPAWSDGEERGVFKTSDGGATWERVLFVDGRTGVADLVMDPSNPEKLLAAMWEFRRRPWIFESGGPGSGLFVTRDGGGSWTRLTPEDGLPSGELGRIGLAFAPSAPEVVYALVEAGRSALLRSDDGGVSWRTVNDERGVAHRPFPHTDIFVDPLDELRLFHLNSRIMASGDGGATFQPMGQGLHADIHALWIDPHDPRLMYVGSDGGMYVTRDRGKNWGMIDNLPTGEVDDVAVDMEIPFNVYGGMQDNGSWRGPSDLWENGGIRNHHWREVGFGDGYGTVPDPVDPNRGYAMSQAGGLVRFDLRTGERKGIRPWAPDTVPLRFNRDAPLALDPFAEGTLYYGSQFVHRTTNGGSSWEIISPDLTTNDPDRQWQGESGGITREATGAENHTTLSTIAPSPVERELIWVGSDDGRVHLTRSGGGHWEDVGRRIRGVPSGSWVAHIEASKHHGGTAYVVFDDHRRGNWRSYVFRTDNYGADWKNIAGEDRIPGFVHTIEEDPLAQDLLFAGTEFGLHVSLNRGEDWVPWPHGVPPVPVRSLVIHPRDHDLVMGTHGRGILVLDDIRPLRSLALSPSLRDLPVYLFDLPPAYLRSVGAVDGYPFAADAMFKGSTRPIGALLTYALALGTEEGKAEIQIVDAGGGAVRTLEGPGRQGLNRLSWDLREDLPGVPEADPALGGSGAAGPEVLPGLYTIRVRTDQGESEATLEVLPDPRVAIPMADRIRKLEANRRGLRLAAALRGVREKSQAILRAVEGALSPLDGREDEEAVALRNRAEGIRSELGRLEDDLAAGRGIRREVSAMGATVDAPTEAERIALSRMEAMLDAAITRINGLIVTRVAELRAGLNAAGLEPLPDIRLVLREESG